MQQSQPIDSKQVEGFSSQFQRRWESVYHWRSMCSMLLGTPGLRAAWPMSVMNWVRPECIDISGNGNHLSTAAAFGNVQFGHDATGIVPLASFGGGANQYLLKVDGGAANWADVLGTEPYMLAADRGLSLGGWFWWAALPGAQEFLMAKDDTGANRSYEFRITAGNLIQFTLNAAVAVASVATINAGWNHIVGFFDAANQDVHLMLNGVLATNAAGPAAIVDTAAPFTIGADGAGANQFTGNASDCFLCVSGLSQGFVRAMYHYTKAAFGRK